MKQRQKRMKKNLVNIRNVRKMRIELRVEFKRQLKIIADIHGHGYAEET